MLNGPENDTELMRIDEASSIYTRETLGDVIESCNSILENESLSAETRERLAKIDSDCCRLIRNRLLLSRVMRFRFEIGKKSVCDFTDVYNNCCATVSAIAKQSRTEISFAPFDLPCNLPITSETAALLLLLPIAILIERNTKADIRLIATKHRERVELSFGFSVETPSFAELAAECNNTDRSCGLFFEETLMARTFMDALSESGAIMLPKKNGLTVSIPIASREAEVNSPCEPYIDNRFSLPYIVLSRIIKREI